MGHSALNGAQPYKPVPRGSASDFKIDQF